MSVIARHHRTHHRPGVTYQLRGEPPVHDVDRLFGFLERDRDRLEYHAVSTAMTDRVSIETHPEVISPIDIPFNQVIRSFGCEGVEAMALPDPASLIVRSFFVFLVMSMIGVLTSSVSASGIAET